MHLPVQAEMGVKKAHPAENIPGVFEPLRLLKL